MKVKLFLLFMVTVLFSASISALAETVYTFGVVPQFEITKLSKIWNPVLQKLQEETGLKFKLAGAPTISAFEKEFLSGQFDFAYMNPFHLLIANESHGYTPLVRDHGKKLQGILVVRNDSKISSVKDLDNQTLAFPSPNALGASMQMRAELHDKFKLNINPKYVKTHDSVYLNVYLKQAAAGGGVSKTLLKQNKRLRDSMRIIHKTIPVAPHPVAVHPRVKQSDREKVLAAFIKISKTAEGQALLAQIPIKQLGKASMSDYQELKGMNLKRFYVAQ
ncbi:MAG: phosphate/phosphite/phosphonate ABC transporter substrate-binding protein [Gammaproteobacteria bacterium]|nr:phosphate/phosphite/phosphonate ABC transporter substrate-binding protein [Gammaproteobacteria bacterium]